MKGQPVWVEAHGHRGRTTHFIRSDGGSSSSSSSDDEETAVVETPTLIMEVDDEADEDSMAVLLDPEMGDGYWLCNVQHVVGMHANQAPGPAQVWR